MKLHIWTGLLSVLSLLTSAQLAPSPDADDASPDGAPTGPQDPDDRYVCSYTASPPRRNIGKGTSLGGWLVLEPWLTPSLFYQFLGAYEKWGDDAPNRVAMDSYTFCTALGKEEANRQLRRHWKTWVNETYIAQLAELGVDTVRIPVGDWMYLPYEPYIGCWDGALEELDRVLKLLKRYGMKALIDVHAVKGGANGMDNGGRAMDVEWLSSTHFHHWDILSASWLGHFNRTTQTYDYIDYDNLNRSLRVVEIIAKKYAKHPTVMGIEPVNEPSGSIPIDILKEFYWQCFLKIREIVPHWLFLFHDRFLPTVEVWGKFLKGCPNCALDSHLYQAWANPADIDWFIETTCGDAMRLKGLRDAGINIIVGEWSVATDNCAMWLNGFNDNGEGYPKVACPRIPCPEPYMGREQPGTPPDATKGAQDPFGRGESYVINGTCPIDKPFDDEDKVMTRYMLSKLFAYSFSSGHFYWNFRTELEYRWDFREVNWRGWMPLDLNSPLAQKEIETICKQYLDPVVPKKETEFHDLMIYAASNPIGTGLAVALLGLLSWWTRKYLLPSPDNFPYTTIEDAAVP